MKNNKRKKKHNYSYGLTSSQLQEACLKRTIASTWRKNTLRYLSTDIICSEKRTVFSVKAKLVENCELREKFRVQVQISWHILFTILEAIVLIKRASDL